MSTPNFSAWWLSASLPSHPALKEFVIPALLAAITQIGQALRRSHHVSLAGTANAFGDHQLNVDVVAEKLIRTAIASCPAIVTASSEEDPTERRVQHAAEGPAETYTVAFDPLDGSSIVGPNWSVGTIIGIWEGESALKQHPLKQVAAVVGVYGPRTTALVAVRTASAAMCFEVGLSDEGLSAAQIVRPEVHLASPPFKTRYFAPANLRAAADDDRYRALVAHYIENKYTLRYSGGLVPDVVHALSKGHGVYISPVTVQSSAKLRKLYELFPMALLIESAGGKAVDPASGRDILSDEISQCDARGGMICGSAEDVEYAKQVFGLD